MNCPPSGLRSRSCALTAVAGIVVFGGIAPAGAQNSDRVFESILDHNGNPLARALSFPIPEGPEGPTFFGIPGLTIDFFEPTVPPRISDRFHFNQYAVSVQSDDDPGGLPARPGAILIPRDALESFTAMYIAAGSDGNQPPGGPDSDHLTIVVGAWGGTPGFTVLDVVLPETPEGELVVFDPFSILFDVEEPDEGQPGWHPGIISDYCDILNVSGFFLSSDNPQDPHYDGPSDGFIIEKDSPEWGRLDYRLNFESDAVPVPGAGAALALGLTPLLARRRR